MTRRTPQAVYQLSNPGAHKDEGIASSDRWKLMSAAVGTPRDQPSRSASAAFFSESIIREIIMGR